MELVQVAAQCVKPNVLPLVRRLVLEVAHKIPAHLIAQVVLEDVPIVVPEITCIQQVPAALHAVVAVRAIVIVDVRQIAVAAEEDVQKLAPVVTQHVKDHAMVVQLHVEETVIQLVQVLVLRRVPTTVAQVVVSMVARHVRQHVEQMDAQHLAIFHVHFNVRVNVKILQRQKPKLS